jgi:hypothetical protein
VVSVTLNCLLANGSGESGAEQYVTANRVLETTSCISPILCGNLFYPINSARRKQTKMITNPVLHTFVAHPEILLPFTMRGKKVALGPLIENIKHAVAETPGVKTTGLTVFEAMRSRALYDIVMVVEDALKIPHRMGAFPSLQRSDEKRGASLARTVISDLIESSTGRRGGTWVHPHIAAMLAMHHSKRLGYAIMEVLSNSPLAEMREQGGDLYKILAPLLQSVYVAAGSSPIKGIAMLAHAMATRVCLPVRADNTTWNYATTAQQMARVELQNAVVGYVSGCTAGRQFIDPGILMTIVRTHPLWRAYADQFPPITDEEVLANALNALPLEDTLTAPGVVVLVPDDPNIEVLFRDNWFWSWSYYGSTEIHSMPIDSYVQ